MRRALSVLALLALSPAALAEDCWEIDGTLSLLDTPWDLPYSGVVVDNDGVLEGETVMDTPDGDELVFDVELTRLKSGVWALQKTDITFSVLGYAQCFVFGAALTCEGELENDKTSHDFELIATIDACSLSQRDMTVK